ncbi:MAG: hypothetical protein Q8L86_09995 [Vicinamibacterales bacterium]|nr:hypothetical protein [Vicinamibacterales bacterium]
MDEKQTRPGSILDLAIREADRQVLDAIAREQGETVNLEVTDQHGEVSVQHQAKTWSVAAFVQRVWKREWSFGGRFKWDL